MQLGAVVRLDRGFPLVATADDTFRAEHAVGFAKSRGEDEVLLPAVGDRVAVRRAPRARHGRDRVRAAAPYEL